MPSINLPFPGLYNTWLSQELDSEIEQFSEYEPENDKEENWPDALVLDEAFYGETVWGCVDYGAAHLSLAQSWFSAFDYWAGEQLDMSRPFWHWSWADKKKKRGRIASMGLKFEEMTSPREYNFTTDRIFATISGRTVATLWKLSKADKHARLAACIKSRFTSHDGFISFYSNRLADWLAKPLADWDENELGTLLRALLTDDQDDALMWSVLESNAGSEAFGAGMNWAKLEERKADKRCEMLRAWLDDDREAALIWRAHNVDRFADLVAIDPDAFRDLCDDATQNAFYRCDKTPDLFAEVAP